MGMRTGLIFRVLPPDRIEIWFAPVSHPRRKPENRSMSLVSFIDVVRPVVWRERGSAKRGEVMAISGLLPRQGRRCKGNVGGDAHVAPRSINHCRYNAGGAEPRPYGLAFMG